MLRKVSNSRVAAAALLLALFHPRAHADEWYENYGKGLDAFHHQQWQDAVRYLSEAIDDRSDSKANAKTYGLQFIDYFPYVYRGVAYFKLGDRAKAQADLEKAQAEGVVQDADKDSQAQTLLSEYLGLVRKSTANAPPPANPTPAAATTDPNFTEGLKLFKQKDYTNAIAKFSAVPDNSAQSPDAKRYIAQAQDALKAIDVQRVQKERKETIDKAFAEGKTFFDAKDYDRADDRFTTVLGLDPSRADAKNYLEKIRKAREKASASVAAATKTPETPHEKAAPAAPPPADTSRDVLFRDAMGLFKSGKIVQAKEKFLALQTKDPAYPDLQKYLQSISQYEEKARRGIAAFLDGEYDLAIDQLNDASRNWTDSPKLYAFLACSYAAQFLLGGEEDKALRQNAIDTFDKTHAVDAHYALDDKLISPRIIALLSGQ